MSQIEEQIEHQVRDDEYNDNRTCNWQREEAILDHLAFKVTHSPVQLSCVSPPISGVKTWPPAILSSRNY